MVNARHLACRQDFDVLCFLCFLDGQECHGGLGVSSVQNIFVRDNDTGLEENRELILQRLRKTLLRGDADFPEGLRSVHRGEEDTALGDVLYGHLLIALAEFFYVLHLFAAMRQPVLNQLQAFNLPVDDGKLLPQDDQRGVDGVIFHVLLNFAQGKTQLFHDQNGVQIVDLLGGVIAVFVVRVHVSGLKQADFVVENQGLLGDILVSGKLPDGKHIFHINLP